MNFKTRQKGVTSIEYGLLAALLVLVIVVAVSSLGTETGGLWGDWSSRFLEAIGAE